MAQQLEATTDRLVGIIAHIKMERRSGQLRVKRGEGLTAEEGFLTFLQGQITQAHVGRRTGADALNWLSTWGRTRYIFLSLHTQQGGPGRPATAPISEPGMLLPRSETGAAARVSTDKLVDEPLQGSRREIPRTCVDFQEATRQIEHAGLSRAHRRLYLLINGQRTIDDLELLLAKKREDVLSMLSDLEWLGLIQAMALPPVS